MLRFVRNVDAETAATHYVSGGEFGSPQGDLKKDFNPGAKGAYEETTSGQRFFIAPNPANHRAFVRSR